MKRFITSLLTLLPLLAIASVTIVGGPKLSIIPSVPPDSGSLVMTGTIDEVNDRADILVEGTAADLGANLMTLEVFVRPATSGNSQGSSTCATGSGYRFPETNIFVDRDNLPSLVRDYGAGLSAGRVCFSIENANGSFSVVGNTDLRDNQWHHVALQYRASDGLIELYVDGVRQATSDGPNGTISLPGGVSGHERFLVFGTEKHGFAAAGFVGNIGPIHLFDTLRYNGATYTVPSAPIAGAVAQYLLAEGTGTVLNDTAGTNDGFIAAGGVPAWSADSPY